MAEYRLRGEWFNLAVPAIEKTLQRYKPDRFKDWSGKEVVRVEYSVVNYIPQEINFPSQEVTGY